MNLKKALGIAISCFLMMGCLTSCTAKKPIVIGFSAGLTGSASEMGVSGRNGLQLAVEAINESGGINGRPVEVSIKDDENNAQTALKVDQELYGEGVSFIIGHMTSGVAQLTLPFVNSNKLLMISPTMSAYSLTGQDDHFITVVSSNDVESQFMVESLLQNGNAGKVAVVYESRNLAYTGTIKDFLAKDLETAGGRIVYEEAFSSGDNPPYYDIVNRVLNAKPDGIVILASSFDAAMFCQQLYKAGSHTSVYLPLWAMNNDLLLQGGAAVEGIHIASLIDTESQSPEYQKFRDTYLSRYGVEPTFPAVYSYEAAMILFEAMKTTNSTDPETVKQAIIGKGSFAGLQGEIQINENGDAKRSLYHYVIKDGQFKKVE
jgi:branched-chain amino acid transport system substrate-binding protein